MDHIQDIAIISSTHTQMIIYSRSLSTYSWSPYGVGYNKTVDISVICFEINLWGLRLVK